VGLRSGQPVVLSGINSTTTGAPRACDTLLHRLYFLCSRPIVTVEPTSLTTVNLFYCGERLRFGFYCPILTDVTAVMPHCQRGLCNLKCKAHLCFLWDGDDIIFSELGYWFRYVSLFCMQLVSALRSRRWGMPLPRNSLEPIWRAIVILRCSPSRFATDRPEE